MATFRVTPGALNGALVALCNPASSHASSMTRSRMKVELQEMAVQFDHLECQAKSLSGEVMDMTCSIQVVPEDVASVLGKQRQTFGTLFSTSRSHY